MDLINAPPIYIYASLSRPESIRILVLHPSEDHAAPLLCDLVYDDRHEVLLDVEQKRGYEAVSYTWGDPIFSHEIFCRGGGEEMARMAITPNVDLLLRHLRKSSKSRRLWVDAICLNQTDHIEKRIQVGLMGGIYRQAKKVHVWLGDTVQEGQETDLTGPQSRQTGMSKVMAFFRVLSLAKAMNDQTVLSEKLISSIFRNEEELKALLQTFLHSSWFQRRWTIQEAALNNNTVIHYGPTEIHWRDMTDALGMLEANQTSRLDNVAWGALNTALNIHSQSGTMLDLLHDHHDALCFDPRDRIAALLSVATINAASNQNGSTLLQWTADYDIAWQENYRNFCASAIKSGYFTHILDHLRFFGSLSQGSDVWPSWVPDWSRPRQRTTRDFGSLTTSMQTNTPEPLAFVETQSGRSVLKVHLTSYFMIGDVTGGDPQPTDSCMKSLLADLWNNFAPENMYTGFKGVSLLVDLLENIMDFPLSAACEDGIEDGDTTREFWNAEILGSNIIRWLFNPDEYEEKHQDWISALKELSKFHSFFRISGGGYGIGTAFGRLDAKVDCSRLRRPPPVYIVTDFGLNDVAMNLSKFQIHQGFILEHMHLDGNDSDEEETCLRIIGHCYYTTSGKRYIETDKHVTLV
ncbi:heterokaryon incompatibility protein-domain-containing protein [Rhexocercosporidium sp. MPI-PUGE-AT-0058]|nr:heterokaryon incompatibility protein-domain-containing protein [Rhexocercosporidium sp. MPI-PUGE-AT-0058]